MTGRPVELFFVRHGESGWNRDGRIQGQSPEAPGLTALGLRQAAMAASALADSGADLVIASDLLRAVQTATPIAEVLSLPVQLDPRLRERSFGEAEGRLAEPGTDELGVRDGQVADADARLVGGESIRELYDRIAGFVDSLRDREGSRIVLVTHGGVVRVARGILSGQSPGQMPWADVANASVWRTRL